ncbi:hypothetical protein PE074_06465 [Wohlfahrtiimonas chitiniclastica]|uniref:hypothetical protein n=1 Tax=Wohlfahrtiimonas chitiniclastica TaxID=400946 RepID=UPI0007BE736F|nr:hypothetical protein [Wohlfahrtiimonas chitiniclastica]KZS22223.1 hypothetical protein BMY_0039 [Wohlfahrtiimonas chitiniclastica]MBS7814763.1 hypothetical protein [Wohlfahrtiimonas chitiniclastica]WHR54738.1 hypothetical protein PE074_06465 [Wohlfahrtiimonas chitiniclastica]
MRKCNTCKKELLESFFNDQSGDDCVLCASKRVEVAKVEKHTYEEVEDNSCAGGACTL